MTTDHLYIALRDKILVVTPVPTNRAHKYVDSIPHTSQIAGVSSIGSIIPYDHDVKAVFPYLRGLFKDGIPDLRKMSEMEFKKVLPDLLNGTYSN